MKNIEAASWAASAKNHAQKAVDWYGSKEEAGNRELAEALRDLAEAVRLIADRQET